MKSAHESTGYNTGISHVTHATAILCINGLVGRSKSHDIEEIEELKSSTRPSEAGKDENLIKHLRQLGRGDEESAAVGGDERGECTMMTGEEMTDVSFKHRVLSLSFLISAFAITAVDAWVECLSFTSGFSNYIPSFSAVFLLVLYALAVFYRLFPAQATKLGYALYRPSRNVIF